MKKVAIAALCLVGLVGACKQALSAADLATRKVACALANRDLSPLQIFTNCNIGPEDEKDILDIISKEKARDEALKKAGCSAADAGK